MEVNLKNGLLAICSVFLSSSAFADCESDARAAYGRITTSGPYHFEKLEWRNGKRSHLIGEVIPGFRIHFKVEGEAREEFIGRARTHRGSRNSLTKDAFGWTRPASYGSARDDDAANTQHFKILGYACLDQVEENRRQLRVFQVTSKVISYNSDKRDDRLFVDAQTGLPLRREITPKEYPERKEITTYRYDPSITIERPKINLKARWNASIKAFEESVTFPQTLVYSRSGKAFLDHGAGNEYVYDCR